MVEEVAVVSVGNHGVLEACGTNDSDSSVGLYMILSLPILCGVYCNNGESGGNVILRNRVGDDGAGWGA